VRDFQGGERQASDLIGTALVGVFLGSLRRDSPRDFKERPPALHAASFSQHRQ
jgi:hypothetical protein